MGLLLPLALTACAPPPASLLRVGTNVWIGTQPLYIAAERGHFDGAAIRLVEYSSASQVLSAFRNNSIEAAALTLDEALVLSEDIDDVRIVLVEDMSAGADVVLSHPEITTLAEIGRAHV